MLLVPSIENRKHPSLVQEAGETDDKQDKQIKYVVCYLVIKSMGTEQGKGDGITGEGTTEG